MQSCVVHLNGCGPAPRFCPGYAGPSNYSRHHSVVLHIQLDMPSVWNMLGRLDTELFSGQGYRIKFSSTKLHLPFVPELLTIWAD